MSTDFGWFKSAPNHICKGLNLREGAFQIMFLAEILDIYKPIRVRKIQNLKVYDLLLEKGLVIG